MPKETEVLATYRELGRLTETEDEYKDFALYGKTAYMGTINIGSQWLNTVKLERLKENMKYVYQILRVGEKEGTEIYSFTTGKVEESSFDFTSHNGGKYSFQRHCIKVK